MKLLQNCKGERGKREEGEKQGGGGGEEKRERRKEKTKKWIFEIMRTEDGRRRRKGEGKRKIMRK